MTDMSEIEAARAELAEAEARLRAMEEAAAAAAPPAQPPEPDRAAERIRVECDSAVTEGRCPNLLAVPRAAQTLAKMWGGSEAGWADGLNAALSARRITA